MLNRPTAPATALLAFALCASAVPAAAQWSGSIGFVSEYIYRGIPQQRSSGSAGLEYAGDAGFSIGTWAADVGDGAEVDLYGSYGGESGDFGYSVGFTGYFYTGDFDDTYLEVNLGGSYGVASLDVAVGQYDNFDGPTQDYTWYALTLTAPFGGYATFGGFAQDFEGEYLELGYGREVADGLEVSVALVLGNDDLLGEADENLVFGITKSFNFE